MSSVFRGATAWTAEVHCLADLGPVGALFRAKALASLIAAHRELWFSSLPGARCATDVLPWCSFRHVLPVLR